MMMERGRRGSGSGRKSESGERRGAERSGDVHPVNRASHSQETSRLHAKRCGSLECEWAAGESDGEYPLLRQ